MLKQNARQALSDICNKLPVLTYQSSVSQLGFKRHVVMEIEGRADFSGRKSSRHLAVNVTVDQSAWLALRPFVYAPNLASILLLIAKLGGMI